MSNVLKETAAEMDSKDFAEVIERFQEVVEIKVCVEASRDFSPSIDFEGELTDENRDVHVTDYVTAVEVTIEGENIVYLADSVDKDTEMKVFLELFALYKELKFNLKSFMEKAIDHPFDFKRYEA